MLQVSLHLQSLRRAWSKLGRGLDKVQMETRPSAVNRQVCFLQKLATESRSLPKLSDGQVHAGQAVQPWHWISNIFRAAV